MLDETSDLSVYETNMNLIYDKLVELGFTVVRPGGTFYIFPKVDTAKFNISSDSQMALDLLKQTHILITPGSGFNWGSPDHFRVVYLPNMEDLKTAMDRMTKFFGEYYQGRE